MAAFSERHTGPACAVDTSSATQTQAGATRTAAGDRINGADLKATTSGVVLGLTQFTHHTLGCVAQLIDGIQMIVQARAHARPALMAAVPPLPAPTSIA